MRSRRAASGGALGLSPWHCGRIHPGTPGSRFAPPGGRAAWLRRSGGSATAGGVQGIQELLSACTGWDDRVVGHPSELGTAIDARRRFAPSANGHLIPGHGEGTTPTRPGSVTLCNGASRRGNVPRFAAVERSIRLCIGVVPSGLDQLSGRLQAVRRWRRSINDDER